MELLPEQESLFGSLKVKFRCLSPLTALIFEGDLCLLYTYMQMWIKNENVVDMLEMGKDERRARFKEYFFPNITIRDQIESFFDLLHSEIFVKLKKQYSENWK